MGSLLGAFATVRSVPISIEVATNAARAVIVSATIIKLDSVISVISRERVVYRGFRSFLPYVPTPLSASFETHLSYNFSSSSFLLLVPFKSRNLRASVYRHVAAGRCKETNVMGAKEALKAFPARLVRHPIECLARETFKIINASEFEGGASVEDRRIDVSGRVVRFVGSQRFARK